MNNDEIHELRRSILTEKIIIRDRYKAELAELERREKELEDSCPHDTVESIGTSFTYCTSCGKTLEQP